MQEALAKHSRHKAFEVKSYMIPYAELPRPVFWFNDPHPAGTWTGRHRHPRWGELAFMKSGYMVMCSEAGNFLVPPQRAVWVPAGLAHEWYIPQPSVDCALYIRPDVFGALGARPGAPKLPAHFQRICSMEISPLVRELVLTLCAHPHEYEDGPVSRMVDVLLDSIPGLPAVQYPTLIPSDPRLIELAIQLINEPDSQGTVREWCRRLGMSERTLARLFQRQTGESFGNWRRHIRLHHACIQLAAGASVTTVALDCGYQSVSSFIALFKKMFGQTPGQFLKANDEIR